jgi:hypothetical protein
MKRPGFNSLGRFLLGQASAVGKALPCFFSHIENGLVSLLSTPRSGAEAGRSVAGCLCLGCFAGSEATRTFGLFADLYCGEC